MNVASVKVVRGQLVLQGDGEERPLSDGTYMSGTGDSITVQQHRIVFASRALDLDGASKEELKARAAALSRQLAALEHDAQLVNWDLQNAIQRHQQYAQRMANVSSTLRDVLMAIVKKLS